MALARAALRMQPDGRLVDLTRDGHDAAFEEIVRRYRSQLVGFAGGIVADHRAEDVVQEALTRAHAALLRDDAEIALKPWLYTIVRNRSLNDLRDEPVHDHLDEDYDGVPQPPAVAERRARLAGLVAGIQALPEAQREALVKREFEGRGHTEIASQMALSPGAVRQLIFRARSTLRDAAGLMIPGPVLRLMLEAAEHREAAAGAGAAAAGAGGAAMALKASVAVLAGGVAIGGGLALRDDHRNDRSRVAVAAEPRPDRAAGREDGGAAGTGGSQTADDQPGGRSGPGAGGGERDDDRGGDGDDGHSGSDDSDSSGPSSSSGPGGDDGGGGEDGRESDDDHSGPGGGGDDEPDEPDDSSGPGGGGGDDEPDERDEPEEPDEPDEPEEDNSGPGGGGERPEEPREELDEPDL
jgi:RNA polymerase sigma factor (sigma-70 family)